MGKRLMMCGKALLGGILVTLAAVSAAHTEIVVKVSWCGPVIPFRRLNLHDGFAPRRSVRANGGRRASPLAITN